MVYFGIVIGVDYLDLATPAANVNRAPRRASALYGADGFRSRQRRAAEEAGLTTIRPATPEALLHAITMGATPWSGPVSGVADIAQRPTAH